MTLDDIAGGGNAVLLALIGADKGFALQVQTRLGEIGLLDPPGRRSLRAGFTVGDLAVFAQGRLRQQDCPGSGRGASADVV